MLKSFYELFFIIDVPFFQKVHEDHKWRQKYDLPNIPMLLSSHHAPEQVGADPSQLDVVHFVAFWRSAERDAADTDGACVAFV